MADGDRIEEQATVEFSECDHPEEQRVVAAGGFFEDKDGGIEICKQCLALRWLKPGNSKQDEWIPPKVVEVAANMPLLDGLLCI